MYSFAMLAAVMLCLTLGSHSLFENVSCAPVQLLGDKENYAVNMLYDNVLVKFPYFDEHSRSIHPELKAKIIEQMTEFFDYLKGFIAKYVNKRSSWGTVQKFYEIGTTMRNMGARQKKERIKLGHVYPSELAYKDKQRQFFKDLTKAATEVEAGLKQQEKEANKTGATLMNSSKLVEDVETLFDQMIAGFAESDSALYVDWEHGQIGDKSFFEVAANLMGRARFHGFGGVLDGVSWLMNFIMTPRKA